MPSAQLGLACVVLSLLLESLTTAEGRFFYHRRNFSSQTFDSSAPSSPITPQNPYVPFPSPFVANATELAHCPPDNVFDVTQFGGVGDGVADDTMAFRNAWKAACGVDSGVLLAPAGFAFKITSTIFSGPCKPGLKFQVDGLLMPPEGPASWPREDSKNQWLVFYRIDSMVLSGSGRIDGNGHKWWDLPCKPHRGSNGMATKGSCESPTLIRFFMCSDLRISGLSIQNSPQFHVKFDGCKGVVMEHLSIYAPKLSPNTDGIHLDNTTSVQIYDSVIANGDDCISIGPGCSSVSIERVFCGPSHGISIGSLGVHNSQAYVSNVSVRDVVIKESDNGVRIKTWQGGAGCVSGISFQNIQMENVRNCIIVDQYYCMSKACLNQTSAVQVTDVSFRNIKGTYDVRSTPIHFACSDTAACTNITLSGVELFPQEGELLDDPFCWNAYGMQETITIPPVNCLRPGHPQRATRDMYCAFS